MVYYTKAILKRKAKQRLTTEFYWLIEFQAIKADCVFSVGNENRYLK